MLLLLNQDDASGVPKGSDVYWFSYNHAATRAAKKARMVVTGTNKDLTKDDHAAANKARVVSSILVPQVSCKIPLVWLLQNPLLDT